MSETETLTEETFYRSQISLILDQGKTTHAPLAHSHSHYYSKYYVSQVGINSLIAAASPLFSMMGRIRHISADYEPSELYLDLIHEIKSFESYTQRFHHRPESILIARYLLVSALDETILNAPWGQKHEWEKHKLLTFFQQEDCKDKNFFVILERLMEEPLYHIDLLELAYLCLSLGYEGRFRFQKQGHKHLAAITQNIFHKIQQVRHELKPDLNPIPLALQAKAKTISKQVLLPFKLFLFSTFLTLAIVGSSLTLQQWLQLNPFVFIG